MSRDIFPIENLVEGLNYKVPATPQTLMADFYLTAYLTGVSLGKLRQAGDNPSLMSHETDATFAAAEAAADTLFPYLKKHLLDCVFFAICAEIRHVADNRQNYTKTISEDEIKFMREYLRNYSFYKSSTAQHGGIPRKSDRVGSTYKLENRGYVESYQAVSRALKQTGRDLPYFVNLTLNLFKKAIWESNYGGESWANIAAGWLRLYETKDTDLQRLAVNIDHVYDLQHNTNTVFNKLNRYYKNGYGWIKQALDFKANVKNPHELLAAASSDLKKIGRRAFHALKIDDIPTPTVVSKVSSKENSNKIPSTASDSALDTDGLRISVGDTVKCFATDLKLSNIGIIDKSKLPDPLVISGFSTLLGQDIKYANLGDWRIPASWLSKVKKKPQDQIKSWVDGALENDKPKEGHSVVKVGDPVMVNATPLELKSIAAPELLSGKSSKVIKVAKKMYSIKNVPKSMWATLSNGWSIPVVWLAKQDP